MAEICTEEQKVVKDSIMDLSFKDKSYEVFNMFDKQWALATAGTIDQYNTCTIGWGTLGDIWGGPMKGRPICTIFISEGRYTNRFLLDNEYFTVSFFPEEYRKDLITLGRNSGRDGDKVALTDLTPEEHEHGVIFKEASLTFVCRKLYWDQFDTSHITDSEIVNGLYSRVPVHYEYIGEIVDVIEHRETD